MYEEERTKGNHFIVNLKVGIDINDSVISLSDTVDYAILLSIVEMRMQVATPLLETIALDISKEIRSTFPVIRSIELSIKKKNPPLHLSIHSSEVILVQSFSNEG